MQIITQLGTYSLLVPNKINKAFVHAGLAGYSLKDRLTIRAADLAFYILIRVIGATIRLQVEGWENFESIERAGKLPIYAFWHDRIFAGTYFFRNRGIAVITSQSKDGEYIARFIQRLGYGAIRGSSTRGGVGALVEMIKAMRAGTPPHLRLTAQKAHATWQNPAPSCLPKRPEIQ